MFYNFLDEFAKEIQCKPQTGYHVCLYWMVQMSDMWHYGSIVVFLYFIVPHSARVI